MSSLPISVVVCTKTEARNIERCLDALHDFDEVVVVDSYSTDNTPEIAQSMGVRVEKFKWNEQYPKKRQWCLDNLTLKHHWVFFVDADEVVTPALVGQLRRLDYSKAGYFIRGQYVFADKALDHGLQNNKLALFNSLKFEFPVVDDLDIPGMGEIEGHYQPCLKQGFFDETVGQIDTPLLHYAYENPIAWKTRHERYAKWEAGMDMKEAWPEDCRFSKRLFKKLPNRPLAAFLHSYVLKKGFKDGDAGFKFAMSRMRYYRMVARAFETAKTDAEKDAAQSTPSFAGHRQVRSTKKAA